MFEQSDTFRTPFTRLSAEIDYESETPQIPDCRQTRLGGGTAVGSQALYSNTTGFGNGAIGFFALYFNTTGWANVAIGDDALLLNTAGVPNTATGVYALNYNTIGIYNTAFGQDALFINTTGNDNTAIGHGALSTNTTGSFNITVGSEAGYKLTTGNYNIDIGNHGQPNDSNTIHIGQRQTSAYIAAINGVTVPGGIGVIIDSTGHLGTTTSSERFKDQIKPTDKASEAIFSFKPVTFRYKKDLDPDGIRQFGLVAEDVEKVNRDLVAHDEQGKPYTVRYDAVNAMLLNEFLKEHRKVEQQRKDFEAALAQQQKQIDALTEGLLRVSAQLELTKSAPQTVLNDQ